MGLRVPLRINSGAVDRSWFDESSPTAQFAAQTNCSRPVCRCHPQGSHCKRFFPGNRYPQFSPIYFISAIPSQHAPNISRNGSFSFSTPLAPPIISTNIISYFSIYRQADLSFENKPHFRNKLNVGSNYCVFIFPLFVTSRPLTNFSVPLIHCTDLTTTFESLRNFFYIFLPIKCA